MWNIHPVDRTAEIGDANPSGMLSVMTKEARMAIDLGHHGDTEVGGRPDRPRGQRPARSRCRPGWPSPIAASLTGSRRTRTTRQAPRPWPRRHRRDPGEVLLTAGAAQAFVLLAQALRGARRPGRGPPAVHRAGGRAAQRRPPGRPGAPARGRRLPARRGRSCPDDADLVFVGNPTNPTSVLHPAAEIAKLARPGRVLVVDEAFADTTYRTGRRRRARVARRTGATCPAWSCCAASPRPGAWPACGSATCSVRPTCCPGWPPRSRSGRSPRRRSPPRSPAPRPTAVAAERAIAARARGRPGPPGGRPARTCRSHGRRRSGQRLRFAYAWTAPTKSALSCGNAAMRCAVATPSPGWAPTGCGSPCATLPPPTRSWRP